MLVDFTMYSVLSFIEPTLVRKKQNPGHQVIESLLLIVLHFLPSSSVLRGEIIFEMRTGTGNRDPNRSYHCSFFVRALRHTWEDCQAYSRRAPKRDYESTNDLFRKHFLGRVKVVSDAVNAGGIRVVAISFVLIIFIENTPSAATTNRVMVPPDFMHDAFPLG